MTLPPAFLDAAMVLLVAIGGGASAPSLAPRDTSSLVAATRHFELRSDPRVALHHFLIVWASADAGKWPPYAHPVAERETWRLLLSDNERRVWSAALEAYQSAVGRSHVFDAGLIALRDWAVGIGAREAIPASDRSLAHAIETALPIYQRHWWAAHHASHRAWIESVAPSLSALEQSVIPRLEAAYGGRWPNARVPIDAVVYANDVGAYSTGGRLTISTTNSMPQALELVFHEASHVDPLEGPLREGLAAAFRARGGTAPDRLWHDMIFYTAGEVTRIVLEAQGHPGYRHYGEFGVYRRGERWSAELPAFERHWKPYLRAGSRDPKARQDALQAFATQLGGQ